MRNVLNRKKNHVSDFSYSSYGHFCTQNCQFSMNFHDNPKNKNRKMDFSFVSAQSASFMKIGAKLREGGGLHILSWDRAEIGYILIDMNKIFPMKP